MDRKEEREPLNFRQSQVCEAAALQEESTQHFTMEGLGGWLYCPHGLQPGPVYEGLGSTRASLFLHDSGRLISYLERVQIIWINEKTLNQVLGYFRRKCLQELNLII